MNFNVIPHSDGDGLDTLADEFKSQSLSTPPHTTVDPSVLMVSITRTMPSLHKPLPHCDATEPDPKRQYELNDCLVAESSLGNKAAASGYNQSCIQSPFTEEAAAYGQEKWLMLNQVWPEEAAAYWQEQRLMLNQFRPEEAAESEQEPPYMPSKADFDFLEERGYDQSQVGCCNWDRCHKSSRMGHPYLPASEEKASP